MLRNSSLTGGISYFKAMHFGLVFLLVFFSSCTPSWKMHLSDYVHRSSSDTALAPDYSALDFWAAHPSIKDLSDSVPLFLKYNQVFDTSVDVFFIHPTTYTDPSKPFGWNAPVLEKEINAKTDYSSILYQASIFNFTKNVYAPRYRQANLDAYFTTDTVNRMKAFMLAYSDVRSAFEYYLKNFNHGRPIIIASHSQGSTHAKFLLREFFDGKPLQKQLVVSYIVGMPVEPSWFAQLKPCATPEQTGCFCSWRTYKKGYINKFVKSEHFVAIVTNPITWRQDVPFATRNENKGSVLQNFNHLSSKVCGASVHDGVLWVEKPHFFGSVLLTTKNYHIADMNFFYMNIRENAVLRINNWNINNKELLSR